MDAWQSDGKKSWRKWTFSLLLLFAAQPAIGIPAGLVLGIYMYEACSHEQDLIECARSSFDEWK